MTAESNPSSHQDRGEIISCSLYSLWAAAAEAVFSYLFLELQALLLTIGSFFLLLLINSCFVSQWQKAEKAKNECLSVENQSPASQSKDELYSQLPTFVQMSNRLLKLVQLFRGPVKTISCFYKRRERLLRFCIPSIHVWYHVMLSNGIEIYCIFFCPNKTSWSRQLTERRMDLGLCSEN